MTRLLAIGLLTIGLTCSAAPAFAQIVNIRGYTIIARTQDRISDKQGLLVGGVELRREGDNTEIYADQVEYFEAEDRVLATGNVVMTQTNNRIAADRAEFNTKTGLGTFYHASGIASIQPPRIAPQPGIVVPTATGVDTDIVFFGEVIEKLGPKKYKITNGGFSSCAQPTPRWDLSADTVILNIDHYTLLKSMVMRVKNVPVLYLPALYFPTKEDGRATGFLIPTYGSTTLRGHQITIPFFWAIGRSHDATIAYDWYSKTGSGTEVDYRYNLGAASNGEFRVYGLNEHSATYQTDTGSTTAGGTRSYTVRGGANQLLPGNLRARANVDYFTSLTTNQTLNNDLAIAANNNSTYSANVTGAWRAVSLNATYYRNEYFSNTSQSGVTGNSPRILLTRSDRPLFRGSPIYYGFSTEILHTDRLSQTDGVTSDDRSVGRFDFAPTLRYPIKKWQWFTVNTNLSYRETFYTRSQDGSLDTRPVLEDNLNRQFFTVGAQAIGPVFTRIWNTPNNGYAERFKHTIEPSVTIQRTSDFSQVDNILVNDSVDSVVPDMLRVEYGINNRIYAKRKVGAISQTQEVLALEIRQSYYSDARGARNDVSYNTSTVAAPSKFSAILANLRVTPSVNINGNVRAEFDSKYGRLRTMSASTSYSRSQRLQLTTGWSKLFFIPDSTGVDNRALHDQALNTSVNLRTIDNKYGTLYSIDYDILRSTLLRQRMTGFYNAQCCGLAFEYQKANYPTLSSFVLRSDHRFFLSFSLAGLGNFSPFNGGLSGVHR